MKIAIWHNLPNGGGKRALFDQVKSLIALGHSVEVWCPSTADLDYLPLKHIVPEHVLPIKYNPSPAKNIIDKIKNLNQEKKLFRDLDNHCKACASNINKRGFDVLLAHPCRFFSAPFIGRYIKIPQVLYLQEPNRYLYEASSVFSWRALEPYHGEQGFVKYLYNMVEDQIRIHHMRFKAREEYHNVSTFDTVLVNSYFTRESVLRAYGIQSQVCYLGVDTDHFIPNKDIKKENIVITVGAITPSKNIDFIVSALSLLGRDKPRLICIGNGIDQYYKETVLKNAHQSNVDIDFILNSSDEEMLRYINKSKIFLYAPRLEPFGFTPLEANACEVPVIGVAEGGIRETIVNNINGILVDGCPSQMADSIKYLLNNPDVIESLGKSARLYVKDKWSLNIAAKRLESILLMAIKSVNNDNRLYGKVDGKQCPDHI